MSPAAIKFPPCTCPHDDEAGTCEHIAVATVLWPQPSGALANGWQAEAGIVYRLCVTCLRWMTDQANDMGFDLRIIPFGPPPLHDGR